MIRIETILRFVAPGGAGGRRARRGRGEAAALDATRPQYSYALDLDGIRVEVTRKSVRNVNLRVGEGGRVRMSVPLRTSRAAAEACAREHLAWMRERRAEVLAREARLATDVVEGDLVPVWGLPRTVRLRAGGAAPSCSLEGSDLVVSGPAWVLSGAEGAAEARRALVAGLLASELARRLPEVLPACEREVGRSASAVLPRWMRTRWGSCTPRTGRIRLNVALAERSPSCLVTVATHELCHLVVPSHGPAFYSLMDAHCPGWRAAQAELDANPPQMFVSGAKSAPGGAG